MRRRPQDRILAAPKRCDVLNRTEYQNAVGDLLALDIDASSLLPADESGHGFDNVTVGDLSPTLLDRLHFSRAENQPPRVGVRSRFYGTTPLTCPPISRRKISCQGCRLARAAACRRPIRLPRTGEYEIQILLMRSLEGIVQRVAREPSARAIGAA